MVQGGEVLLTVAEIAIGLAGFSGCWLAAPSEPGLWRWSSAIWLRVSCSHPA